jgi:hypothetical protein
MAGLAARGEIVVAGFRKPVMQRLRYAMVIWPAWGQRVSLGARSRRRGAPVQVFREARGRDV